MVVSDPQGARRNCRRSAGLRLARAHRIGLALFDRWVAIVTGILEIVAAVHLHRAHGEWLLVLNGVLSVLFGLLVILWPGAGLLTLLWMLGAYTIFFGVLLVALAVRLRSHHHRQSSAVA